MVFGGSSGSDDLIDAATFGQRLFHIELYIGRSSLSIGNRSGYIFTVYADCEL